MLNKVVVRCCWKTFFSWWRVNWKEVENVDEFFLSLFIQFIDRIFKKALASSGSSSSVGALESENDKIFNKKLSKPTDWLFHTKLRALIWLKSVQGKPIGHLDGWWVNPSAVTNIKRKISRAFGVSFKFSVATVNINNFWAYGGILLSKKEEVRAIFAAPSLFPGLFSAELEAILVALKFFVAAEAFGGRELVVESSSRVVVNWLNFPLQRPRHRWKILADIDTLVRQLNLVSFASVCVTGRESAVWLARDGALSRK
ncbi:hypothetical protein GQ457_05G013930 [Hibiscus cannabinus]